jgi:hypothetical protein
VPSVARTKASSRVWSNASADNVIGTREAYPARHAPPRRYT